ncbi:hypothetical protein ACER1D_004021 [Vibrio alginolyticus]|nr:MULTISPECIES: hypothetical protein [Vibrio]MCU8491401.1 hypothetical protein [Vibrio vulnificus]EGQ8220200.1 hypothetical protein [Vibrio parahaemolyticus]EGQ8500567.1 hypothetical protein [Vibrio parahaemolyticus]EHJ9984799.1 hypothetical protein [Vibrio parahaemolyticus]EJG2002364.1 hypothetical protein [Vibrio parahaemolyticus]
MYENQIQCAECLCTLYFTGENGAWGITGELCYDCQKEKDLMDGYDDDDD